MTDQASIHKCAACGVTLDQPSFYVVKGEPWCGPCYWKAYP